MTALEHKVLRSYEDQFWPSSHQQVPTLQPVPTDSHSSLGIQYAGHLGAVQGQGSTPQLTPEQADRAGFRAQPHTKTRPWHSAMSQGPPRHHKHSSTTAADRTGGVRSWSLLALGPLISGSRQA
jgi:hypothetical protein